MTNSWTPIGGAHGAGRRRDNPAINVVVEAGEIEISQIAIHGQDIPRPFFIGFDSESVAYIGPRDSCEIGGGNASLHIIWTKQDFCHHELFRGDRKLPIHVSVISSTWHCTALGRVDLPRELALVIICPKPHAGANLFEITQTHGPLRLNPCSSEGWEQEGRENGDDRHDHQQLDQREGVLCRTEHLQYPHGRQSTARANRIHDRISSRRSPRSSSR